MAGKNLDPSWIKSAGWRQGSVLPASLVDGLVEQGRLPSKGRTGHWVVISHSCDVTQVSLEAEPWAEVLFLEPLDPGQIDGNFTWWKNPRTLHVVCEAVEGASSFKISACDRVTLPREDLIGHEPDATRPLDARSIRLVANWVARRYVRDAFPDAFNERCRAAFTRQLRRDLRTKGKHLTGIYVLIDSERELVEGTDYRVIVLATTDPDTYSDSDQRSIAQELLDAIEAALHQQPGIVVTQADLRSEADLSIHDLRYLKRLDFDNLSVRETGPGDKPQLPP